MGYLFQRFPGGADVSDMEPWQNGAVRGEKTGLEKGICKY